MNEKKIGKCKLCGQTKPLTYEHVPPAHAFNNQAVTKYGFDEVRDLITGKEGRLPWEVDGLKGQIVQRGTGDYYLCAECNNNTGSWYVSNYTHFAEIMHSAISNEKLAVGGRYSLTVKEQYPLRLFKAIMTMFCDINDDCFGDLQIREFLLEKELKGFNHNKYKLYLYLAAPEMQKIAPLSVKLNLNTGDIPMAILMTEIACYPIGVILCIDQPEEYFIDAVNINSWADFDYYERGDISFIGLPYHEINTMFPGDFRSKEAIIETINRNNTARQNFTSEKREND